MLLEEDFANNNAGWTLGPEWAIGPAVAGCDDPVLDATPTPDNGVAGVVIGGCASQMVHAMAYLTSPVVDTSAAPSVFLSFKRWLQSDYQPYMTNSVEVFDGASWITVWSSGGPPGVKDIAWSAQKLDLSAHKNAQMQVRWGVSVPAQGAYSAASWSLDDAAISTDPACP